MKARSSISLSGRSRSDSKTHPLSFRPAGPHWTLDDQLVDERPLARAGTQQPAHALDVLALAHPPATTIPTSASGTSIPSLRTCAETSARSVAGAEAVQHLLAFGATDVAGERHDQVLARHRVGGLVVGHEHQRALGPVMTEQQRQRLALAAGERQDPARPPPGGDPAPPFVGPRGLVQEVFPIPSEVVPFEGAARLSVDLPERVVLAALVGIQRQMPGDPLERRQVSSGQIPDAPFEHHRADQRRRADWRPGPGAGGVAVSPSRSGAIDISSASSRPP